MCLINCKECGKQISNTAKACPYCGYYMRSSGIVIASMVLGIISCVYAFGSCVSNVCSSKEQPTILPLIIIFGLLSIIFGFVANKKGIRSKKSISGIIMGITSIIISVIFSIITNG